MPGVYFTDALGTLVLSILLVKSENKYGKTELAQFIQASVQYRKINTQE